MRLFHTRLPFGWLRTLAFLICFAGDAQAQVNPIASTLKVEPRVALIIANSNYTADKDKLGGPVSDAGEVNKALRRLGFSGLNGASSPTVVFDRSQSQIRSDLLTFRNSLRKAGPLALGVVYYAGHGAADTALTDNFMLPVDVADVSKVDAARDGVGIRWLTTDVLSQDDAKERPTVVIIFDACRTAASAPGGKPLRLVVPDAQQPDGLLVALSTGAGQSASDDGRYAEVLARKLSTPGLSIGEMFDQVKLEVAAKSGNLQIPVYQSNIVRRICTAGCISVAGADPLATLEAAMRNRPLGDLGQVGAAEALVSQGKALSGLDLMGIGFKEARIDGVDLRQAKLDGVDLGGASMANAKLDEARLNLADLRKARLQGASAESAWFQLIQASGADLSGIRASRSTFLGASLSGASLMGADLRGASFMLADVRGADFRGADLSDAVFVGALLDGARFDRAKFVNVDVTSAVGKPTLFSAEQQAQLCASETSGRFTFRLQRGIKVPNGIDVRDIYSWSVELSRSLHMLNRCARRTVEDVDQSIWTDRQGVGHLDESLELRYPDELLQAGNRRTLFTQRVAGILDVQTVEQKSSQQLQIGGSQSRERLAAMKRNAEEVKIESSSIVLANDALLLYLIKHGQQIFSEEHWTKWAREHAALEVSIAGGNNRAGFTRWSPLFPAGTTPATLGPEHVEVFRQWTLQRARKLPEVAEISARAERALTNQIRQAAKAAPKSMLEIPVRPGGAVFPESWSYPTRQAIASKVGQELFFPGTMSNSGICGSTVVRVEPAVRNAEVQIPRSEVEDTLRHSLRIDFSLKVVGASVTKVEERTVCIVDTQLIALQLRGGDLSFSSYGRK